MSKLQSICVFCGASPGVRPEYVSMAEAMGAELVRRGIRLVYGGGTVGLMGTVSRAVMNRGGSVTGIIPRSLQIQEQASHTISELVVVESMTGRKVLMFERSDGFITMPGGFGTLDELFEAITFGQLGIHTKPVGLLNISGFFDPLLVWIDGAIDQGFVRPYHRGLLLVDSDPAALIDKMEAYQAPEGLVVWKNK
ncbi:MAG: TIGR00730 family Rossman fold protein [Caldilineaceae bacterium]